MSKLNILVNGESPTGRNTSFKVNGKTMTRAQTVRVINSTQNSGYHTRKINGLNTPVSNPDGSTKNNLG